MTNGVDLDALTQTIQAVKEQPEIAKFKFNVSNRRLGGGHNRSTVGDFYGAMQQLKHSTEFVMDAGEPPVLLGNDQGANPVEFLLRALYHAAGQGIVVEAIESTIDGDIDLRGFLGLDPGVRKGFQQIRMSLKIKTEAGEREWEELVALGPTFSPVFDSITRGVPVAITTERM